MLFFNSFSETLFFIRGEGGLNGVIEKREEKTLRLLTACLKEIRVKLCEMFRSFILKKKNVNVF